MFLFPGVGLNSNQIVVDYSHKVWASVTLLYLVAGSVLYITGIVTGLVFPFLLWQHAEILSLLQALVNRLRKLSGGTSLIYQCSVSCIGVLFCNRPLISICRVQFCNYPKLFWGIHVVPLTHSSITYKSFQELEVSLSVNKGLFKACFIFFLVIKDQNSFLGVHIFKKTKMY